MKNFPTIAMILTFGFVASCNKDPNVTKLQYVPDMADAPTQKTQRNYIDPPEGAVAMSSLQYPKTPEEAEKELTMPAEIASADPEAAQGKKLFNTYCYVCHGEDGKGAGPVVGKEGEQGLMAPPPNLMDPVYVARGDGFFFHRITFGANIMPGYGHAITPVERWHIVKYLRILQKAGVNQ